MRKSTKIAAASIAILAASNDIQFAKASRASREARKRRHLRHSRGGSRSHEVTEVELVESSTEATEVDDSSSSQDGATIEPPVPPVHAATKPISADVEQSSSSDQRSPRQVDDERPATIDEALPVGSYVDIISPHSGRSQIAKVLAVTPSSGSGSSADFSYILEHGMLRHPMKGIDASIVKAYEPYSEGAEAYCHIDRDSPVDCTVGEFREAPDGMGLYTVKFTPETSVVPPFTALAQGKEISTILPFTNVQMKLDVKR